MTYKEIKNLIASIGLDYTYYSFPVDKAPPLPYIVFFFPDYNDLGADNINYQIIASLNIELYTENKDFVLEKQIENVLTAHDLYFVKRETYLESENMYMVLYEIDIVIGEENG